jgi:hypothetical protein
MTLIEDSLCHKFPNKNSHITNNNQKTDSNKAGEKPGSLTCPE